ncbi:hypothetical protein [Streptomyces sp. CA-106110]|uniref:hypothetical protein n=1 Tax=Streptomyces sp. CA-106110 TaxID=3240044 RepID=UPI003D8F910B
MLALDGYVGPAEEGKIRLYADLRLAQYVEIPTDDVVRIVQDTKTPEKPCIVFFKGTAEVTYVQTMTVRAERVADMMPAAGSKCAGCSSSGAAAREVGNGGGPASTCASCDTDFALCEFKDDRWPHVFWCALKFVYCRLTCSPTFPPIIF